MFSEKINSTLHNINYYTKSESTYILYRVQTM